jgi:hypothetical protein
MLEERVLIDGQHGERCVARVAGRTPEQIEPPYRTCAHTPCATVNVSSPTRAAPWPTLHVLAPKHALTVALDPPVLDGVAGIGVGRARNLGANHDDPRHATLERRLDGASRAPATRLEASHT